MNDTQTGPAQLASPPGAFKRTTHQLPARHTLPPSTHKRYMDSSSNICTNYAFDTSTATFTISLTSNSIQGEPPSHIRRTGPPSWKRPWSHIEGPQTRTQRTETWTWSRSRSRPPEPAGERKPWTRKQLPPAVLHKISLRRIS
jgi:hypothetical protein